MKHETGGRNKGHIRGLFFCPMNSIFYLPKWKSRLTDLFSVHVTALPVRLMIAAMFPPQLSSRSSHLGTSQRRSTDTRAKKYGLANIHTHFWIFYPFGMKCLLSVAAVQIIFPLQKSGWLLPTFVTQLKTVRHFKYVKKVYLLQKWSHPTQVFIFLCY